MDGAGCDRPGVEQVALVPDEGAVEQLMAAGPYPPFHDRVYSGHLDAAAYDLDTGVGPDRVEQPGLLAVPVADEVAGVRPGIVEVHGEVAGGLGDPRRGGVGGDAEDADAAAGVFDHRKV